MTARSLAMARAVGVIAATTAIVTGITFAQLNTTATLQNTTITTATADLTIWNGSTFTQLAPGFTVTGLVPGQWSAEQPFYLKNSGTGNLAITANIPNYPTYAGITDWSKVYVRITNTYQGTNIETNMQALHDGAVAFPPNALPAGAQGNSGGNVAGNYSAAFYIDPASVTGSSAHIDAFDIVLTGTLTP